MNKWISVKERVPEKWRPVLAVKEVLTHRMVEVAVYVGNGEWKLSWNHDQLTNVTYWMSLPELPELNEGQSVRTGCGALIKMKIRLMPLGMALITAQARRNYLGLTRDVPWGILLHRVPVEWFDADCFLTVVDIDYDGNFLVLDAETGEEYSIPAWMVSDIVKVKEEQ